MRSVLDGLVICPRLFFMLHLPLFGCALYWFSSHDVKRHTKLAGIVFRGPTSADTEKEPFPAESCLAFHNVRRVRCQSVIVVNWLIVSAEVMNPVYKEEEEKKPHKRSLFWLRLSPCHTSKKRLIVWLFDSHKSPPYPPLSHPPLA